MQARPLEGIRVIDYSHFLAGPYVGRCLAGLGAEVIKVERPGSGDAGRQHATVLDDKQSGYFLQLNMGKRGVSVNMKDPRGKAFMQRLCDSADVFIENYRPGALDKLGLGYAALSERNPRLIYCSISAYGHTGPDAHRAGFGLIAEAKSGIMQMVGTPGERPPLLRISLGDMYTGIHAVAAINAALLGRERSGRGQHIDMALYDTLVSMHEYAVQCYTMQGVLPEQTGHDMPTSTLYGVFRASDGDLVIAAQVDDAWKRFAELVEKNGGPAGFGADGRFHTLTGRNTFREEILSVVQPWVAAHSVAKILALLDSVDVPCAKVQRIDEVLSDPQIVARGMVVEQHHPRYGTLRLPNLPFRFSDCDTAIRDVAPDHGQHNAEVAQSLGFTPAEIEAMQSEGVLYSR
ncbi:crotonobetainyl-CoA:carnitine CoA-transferase CaiB-like acyl-CoA transferase [Ralstonia sp. GP73]|jgi:crotonobetainyl-CoA:carnitine CoA-transferase CaiB-like acyl-CoA transferase|uniref:Acetyl-CoA:oxalate CoA-transferase n=1 Tax=Ralstonia thomasii TaxID=3058596 RepID=A0ABM9JXV2_9RALS|nr:MULTISPECIES: CoA transferase [Ralstonia]MDH6641137.1 crotonobetainyl-CoA:carnitine CoA-transferase CaiB-like acyl-CoA transferase [Ralstonia sp. GP73]OCS45618.1 formyl-CoA transferase [Ralstonia pickettii]CAJ0706345.1 Acetyl-CoA:oxalate CoA-transferase [Ralstonia sp. LMG 18095]CAJ0807945.1 Acetyl-CoA:oxalate CoA-transferase [Ralstonia sp. LMG 18095]CAJ0859198.1 Acetyl-CoA:oxalate CoA-transferase [Ralstonia sp. LMG 18095]